MDTGYAMEGDNRETERERLHFLNQSFNQWFAEHPEITTDSESLEHFAMSAVARLVGAFVFNDGGRPAGPKTGPRHEAQFEWQRRRNEWIQLLDGSEVMQMLDADQDPLQWLAKWESEGDLRPGTLRALIEKNRGQ